MSEIQHFQRTVCQRASVLTEANVLELETVDGVLHGVGVIHRNIHAQAVFIIVKQRVDIGVQTANSAVVY